MVQEKNKQQTINNKQLFSIFLFTMSLSYSLFNNNGRIGFETHDQTQREIANNRYQEATASPFISNVSSHDFVHFATQQPGLMGGGTVHGHGLSGANVANENNIFFGTTREKDLERLMLIHRPFITVPYTGRGTVDPTLELQLRLGEKYFERKSISTMSEKSLLDYQMPPDGEGSIVQHYQSIGDSEDQLTSTVPRQGTNTRLY